MNSKWKLHPEKGVLRLHTMPARQFLWAKNTLTQRGIGPVSSATVSLDAAKLKQGDIAGLGLLNMPYATLGVTHGKKGYTLCWYAQENGRKQEVSLENSRVYLRVTGVFDRDMAQFSYSLDGQTFINIGDSVCMPYQLKTFQGTRYALFAYNTEGKNGGYAEFDDFKVDEPMADRSANLPIGKVIRLTNRGDGNLVWASAHGMLRSAGKGSREAESKACLFRVHDKGKGRVALEALDGSGFVTVVGAGLAADVRMLKKESEGSVFQWQDMLYGQCMLLSLKTQRFVGLHPETGEPYSADWPGTYPDRKDGTVFTWEVVEPK